MSLFASVSKDLSSSPASVWGSLACSFQSSFERVETNFSKIGRNSLTTLQRPQNVLNYFSVART